MPRVKETLWVAVADGGKALLLRNDGTELKPDLVVLSAAELANPPAREQGSDKPGRMADRGPNQRSSVEETDYHRFAKERFAADLGERLTRAAETGAYDALVLVAPPRVLGDLRRALGAQASARIRAEIDRDLTHHPVPEIEAQLVQALKPGFA